MLKYSPNPKCHILKQNFPTFVLFQLSIFFNVCMYVYICIYNTLSVPSKGEGNTRDNVYILVRKYVILRQREDM